jgi:hypothetical protein
MTRKNAASSLDRKLLMNVGDAAFTKYWADSIAEGTPVVNADGLLVGMCSHGSNGPELVSAGVEFIDYELVASQQK